MRKDSIRKGETSSGGIGVCGLLLVAFVFCKLAQVTAISSWSWLWVLSPIWIPTLFVISIILIILIIVGLGKLVQSILGGR